MRVTTDPCDPDYKGVGYRVLLDGVERSRVFEASEEGRYIVIAEVDEKGNVVLDRSSGDVEIKRVRLMGTVYIEKMGQPAPSAQPPEPPPRPLKKGWW